MKFLDGSRAPNFVGSGPIWLKLKFVQDFMPVLITNCKSMGAFCCHGNQSFDPICTNPIYSLSPTPVMLHIKFDQDWPTCLRDIQVQRRRQTADHWYTISSSSELKSQIVNQIWLTLKIPTIWIDNWRRSNKLINLIN